MPLDEFSQEVEDLKEKINELLEERRKGKENPGKKELDTEIMNLVKELNELVKSQRVLY